MPERRGGGKKILGMPRNVVIIGGVALAGGVLYFWWRSRQAGAATGTGTQADTTGTDYAGDISALQSEFGNLASEVAAMQGTSQPSQATDPSTVPPKPKIKPVPKVPAFRPPVRPKPKLYWSSVQHKWLTPAQWTAAHRAHVTHLQRAG